MIPVDITDLFPSFFSIVNRRDKILNNETGSYLPFVRSTTIGFTGRKKIR